MAHEHLRIFYSSGTDDTAYFESGTWDRIEAGVEKRVAGKGEATIQVRKYARDGDVNARTAMVVLDKVERVELLPSVPTRGTPLPPVSGVSRGEDEDEGGSNDLKFHEPG